MLAHLSHVAARLAIQAAQVCVEVLRLVQLVQQHLPTVMCSTISTHTHTHTHTHNRHKHIWTLKRRHRLHIHTHHKHTSDTSNPRERDRGGGERERESESIYRIETHTDLEPSRGMRHEPSQNAPQRILLRSQIQFCHHSFAPYPHLFFFFGGGGVRFKC